MYYVTLCVCKASFTKSGLGVSDLLSSGPFVAAIAALVIAIYSNRTPQKPKLKFYVADVTPFPQQYNVKNFSGQPVVQHMMRLYCVNESDVVAEDVTIEIVSVKIPSPLNWTHQNPSNGIAKTYDIRNILPHQKAYIDLLEQEIVVNQNTINGTVTCTAINTFYFSSHPLKGTLFKNVKPRKQTIEMVYHTKNGVFGSLSVDFDNQGPRSPNTKLSNLRQN